MARVSVPIDATPPPRRQEVRDRRPSSIPTVSTWSALADLPLDVDGYDLEPLHAEVTSGFTRVTTVVRLRGGGEEGLGEDVGYEPQDHAALHAAGRPWPLAGRWTLESFSRRLDEIDLWPEPPHWEQSRNHRRWGLESAALDLALRQSGRTLTAALGREPSPVTFVVSLRLPEPPTAEPVLRWLARDATLRFKLDPTPSWDAALVEELADTGAVDTVDLKGAYERTVVDNAADPALYRRVAEGFPGAWIEDPRLTPETEEVLRPYRARVTWDAVIHSVADVDALPFPPRMVNVKPSRFGTLRALLECHDALAARGIGAYGGGQFELGPGRGQIQYLASLFHPGTPNDVAPRGYNEPVPPRSLPRSPLAPAPADAGFRWG
jgi:L-alanine-DL-glutamate epimerase-like enolase superfamily enzyme